MAEKLTEQERAEIPKIMALLRNERPDDGIPWSSSDMDLVCRALTEAEAALATERHAYAALQRECYAERHACEATLRGLRQGLLKALAAWYERDPEGADAFCGEYSLPTGLDDLTWQQIKTLAAQPDAGVGG